MVKVRLAQHINGYNPPENYAIISTLNSRRRFVMGEGHTLDINATHSITNGIGTIHVSKPDTIYDTNSDVIALSGEFSVYDFTVVTVDDPDNRVWYCGLIDRIRTISSNVYEITYTVDWYTSEMLTSYDYKTAPNIETILFKRKSDGEFNYVDEGFIPRTVTETQYELMSNASGIDISLFSGALNDNYIYNCFMVYHDSPTDTDHWFIYWAHKDGTLASPYPDAQVMWGNYCNAWGIEAGSDSHNFNPDDVHYFGYINIFPENMPYTRRFSTSDYNIYVLNEVLVNNNRFAYTFYKTPKSTGTCTIYDKSTLQPLALSCKEYSRFVIRDLDFNELYSIPLGLTVKGFKYSASMSFSANPYITFEVTDFIDADGNDIPNNYNGYATFSVTAKPLEFYVDAKQVYYAEDRIYQQELRNLQSVNDFVSGMTGAAQQGAMVSAFSRNQTSTGTSKGLIAGGVAAVGQFFSTGYQFLYANKEAQRIEDDHYRRKADTLLMSGSNPFSLCDLAGGYLVTYDVTTINAILSYQSKFGYQTNTIGSNVALNSFTGYVQGEVILAPGLRTEIESYIMEMFRNGVKFNAI